MQVDVTQANGNVRQVFLDPSSGKVHGAIDESARVMTFVKHLHSLTVLGNGGRMVIETVAGWIIVLILTGAYLWWPRGRQPRRKSASAPVPKAAAWWRDLHAVTGAFGGIIILFLAMTGMPWSVVWGQQVNRWLSEHDLGAPKGMWSNLPHSTVPASALGDMPWTLQQQPLPCIRAIRMQNTTAMATITARQHRPAWPASDADQAVRHAGRCRHAAEATAWCCRRTRKPSTAPSARRANWPAERVIHLSTNTAAKLLMDLGADRIGAIGRVTEWGVSVHQGGEYGWINQMVMLLGCVALMLLCVSGVVVWWKRRPTGNFAPPPCRQGDRLALGAIVIAVVIGVVFPLLGASMLLAALLTARRKPSH